MGYARVLCVVAGLNFAAAAVGRGVAAPPVHSAQPISCKVLHLHIKGDLDSLRLAREFADALGEARADGVEAVVLELSGNRWRADVVHAMAKALREPESAGKGTNGSRPHASRRIVALLGDDADRRVGFGQAALALLADSCALAARSEIAFDAADDLRATAGPDTDWERVDRELQGLIYLAAKDRQADVLLGALLPRPTGPLWAAPGADLAAPWRLGTMRPANGAATLVVSSSEEGREARVRIDSGMGRNLGLLTCQAQDAGQLLAASGLRARPVLRKELVSGLGAARERITRLMSQLDDAARAIEIDTAQAARRRGYDATRLKREAGDRALRTLEDGERHLLDAEAVMTDYPELLADLPPGRTPVGQDPEKHPLLWRWQFQDLRDTITALRAKAEELSRTP